MKGNIKEGVERLCLASWHSFFFKTNRSRRISKLKVLLYENVMRCNAIYEGSRFCLERWEENKNSPLIETFFSFLSPLPSILTYTEKAWHTTIKKCVRCDAQRREASERRASERVSFFPFPFSSCLSTSSRQWIEWMKKCFPV